MKNSDLVLSYLDLRKMIGIIGLTLPWMLLLGKHFLGESGIEPSISDYYYTVMRDVFVGSLCAIGVFLWSYQGYPDSCDKQISNLTCVFAIGTALFPTTQEGIAATSAQELVGYIHYACAVGFLLSLAYISLFQFTKGVNAPTPKKLLRNKVYRYSGSTILISIVLLAGIVVGKQTLDQAWLKEWNLIFWFETIAVSAFGVSWLVKGEAILKDQ